MLKNTLGNFFVVVVLYNYKSHTALKHLEVLEKGEAVSF